METEKKKCSLEKHKDKEAFSYCTKCEKYMCKKCEQIHSDFFESKHSLFIYESKNFENIKNNKEISELAQLQIQENIKYLKEFFPKLKEKNEKLKTEFEKVEQSKEELLIKIQKYFTRIRNELNNIEDEFTKEIEEKFEKLELNQEIKKNEIVLNKITLVLTKGIIQLDSLINECKNISIKYDDINKYNKKIDIEIPDEKQINEICDKIKSLNDMNKLKLFFDSSIIKNDFKKQYILNNWIKEKMGKDILKYELIFKMTENGEKPEDFHKHCDNKGPTLIIIKTTSNRIFGGFTPLNWNNDSDLYYDNTKRTFVFSLNLMKKYELKTSSSRAIYNQSKHGPTFGFNDNGAIVFKSSLKEGISYAKSDSNYLSDKNLELTNGTGNLEHFDTTEIEVFKVE